MPALALGIDVGTQGTKALVVDFSRPAVVARASCSYGLIDGLPAGAAEQHPATWAEAVRAVLADLAGQGVALAEIACVGVSGQQHGLVLLDADGDVVRPAKLWCDTSTVDEASRLSEKFGSPVPVGFTASKVAWVQQHEPDSWARTATVMLPHDYINFLLTGERRMEAGDASGTGFFDIAERCFDTRLVDLIGNGLADRLPPLIDAPQPAGVIGASAAAWSGLAEGAVVSAGGGDNMMSAIGSGATTAGIGVISLGTSATAFTHADAPVVDPDGLIAPFCGSCGGWLPLLCTMNATAVVEEVRRAFGVSHGELTRDAEQIAPGSDGLVWLPYLMGERVPDLPEATGTLLGMRHGWLDRGRLYRAAIEGVSANIAWGVARLERLGVSLGEVRVVGGGADNPLWRQILADMLGVSVTPLLEGESAALGAAIQGEWTRRRADGDDARIESITRGLLQSGDRTEPSSAAGAYAEYRERFDSALRRQHGR